EGDGVALLGHYRGPLHQVVVEDVVVGGGPRQQVVDEAAQVERERGRDRREVDLPVGRRHGVVGVLHGAVEAERRGGRLAVQRVRGAGQRRRPQGAAVHAGV